MNQSFCKLINNITITTSHLKWMPIKCITWKRMIAILERQQLMDQKIDTPRTLPKKWLMMMKKAVSIEVGRALVMEQRMMTDWGPKGWRSIAAGRKVVATKRSLAICRRYLMMISRGASRQMQWQRRMCSKVKTLLLIQKERKGLKLIFKAVQIAYMLENYTLEHQVKRLEW